MLIIYGQQKCGKVDVVPRLFYVTTRFFHLYYVPLIPLASYLVLAGTESGDKFQGRQIPLCWKSILAGWVRAVLVPCMAAGAIMAFLVMIDIVIYGRPAKHMANAQVPLCLLVLSVLAYGVTRIMGRASYGRAHALANMLAIEPAVIDRHFGIGPDLGESAPAAE